MSETYTGYQARTLRELEIVVELLQTTYPLSKDPKVLVSALAHLKEAKKHLLAFLKFMGEDGALEVLEGKISIQELHSLREVQRLYGKQQQSGVEFRRKNTYIICDDEYNTIELNYDILGEHLKNMITVTKKIFR